MPEIQQEDPDAWKINKSRNDFEPGVYDQIIKEYPDIKIDTKPGKSAKPVISFNGKSIDFWIRIPVITLWEIREVFGEPILENKDAVNYSPWFSISRINTKTLNRLDNIAKFILAKAQDGTPAIKILLNDDYAATKSLSINWENYPLWSQINFHKNVMKVETYMMSRSGWIPLILKSTIDDGTNEFITIYRKTN